MLENISSTDGPLFWPSLACFSNTAASSSLLMLPSPSVSVSAIIASAEGRSGRWPSCAASRVLAVLADILDWNAVNSDWVTEPSPSLSMAENIFSATAELSSPFLPLGPFFRASSNSSLDRAESPLLSAFANSFCCHWAVPEPPYDPRLEIMMHAFLLRQGRITSCDP